MKVYVLVNEWAYDYAQDMNVQVFMFESEAQKAMKEGYEDFVSHNFDADGVFNVKECHDDNASVYSDGDWSCNHIAWNIYERDLNDGAEPVVWLAKEDLAFRGFATECEDVSLKTIASIITTAMAVVIAKIWYMLATIIDGQERNKFNF